LPHSPPYCPYEPPLNAQRIVERDAQQTADFVAAAAQAASRLQQIQQQQRESNQQQVEEDKKSQEQAQQAAAVATCSVCMDAAPSVLYLPCKHYKVCERCDEQLERRDPCPVCRTQIEGRISQLHL
jgi:hypothetical protein